MCYEHRPTLAVTEMSGDRPKKVTSITVANNVLYTYLVGFLALLVGGVGFMKHEANQNFNERILEALQSDGILDKGISSKLEVRTHSIEIRLAEINVKLANIEALLKDGR